MKRREVEFPSENPAEKIRADLYTCVYQKLDSAILVVKSTENWV
jgi:hypothetical protein